MRSGVQKKLNTIDSGNQTYEKYWNKKI